MEPSNQGEVKSEGVAGSFAARQPRLFCVTRTSKYLALTLFIILPFLGGYVGYMNAPEKVVEVESIVEIKKETPSVEKRDSMSQIQSGTDGLSFVQTDSVEFTQFTQDDIYFTLNGASQYIGTEANCKLSPMEEVGQVTIDQYKEKYGLILRNPEVAKSIAVVQAVSCYSPGGGTDFAIVSHNYPANSGYEADGIKLIVRSMDEAIGYGQWRDVLSVTPEGEVYYSYPLQHLRLLEESRIEKAVVEAYRDRLQFLY